MKNVSSSEYLISMPLKPIGMLWIIPGPNYGFAVAYYKKPNFFRRWLFRFLLGWEFVPDAADAA